MQEDTISEPHEPGFGRWLYWPLALLANFSLSDWATNAWIDARQLGNFEGKSGFAYAGTVQVCFALFLVVLIAVYIAVRRSHSRLSAANIVLGLLSLPAVSFIAELLR